LHSEGGNRSLLGSFSRDQTSIEDAAMFATFLIEVNEQGRAVAAHALDAFPDGRAARRLSGNARSTRYNAVPAGTGPRFAFRTVSVNFGSLKLVPDAPANARSRVRG
jgi:hypothetical protein